MTAWPQGYLRQMYAELDSTNEEARRLAEGSLVNRLWIVAERQTAGRGRRGRPWQSPIGNLSATLLLRPQISQSVSAQLSFAAALAVADVAVHFCPDASITVKWPNDVLANGRKIAGVLLEAGNGWLAIGIGINLAHYPVGTEFPATSVAAVGSCVPPLEEAQTLLAARFAYWYDVWIREGFGPLRERWLEQAMGLGKPIRARLPKETRNGVFEGIDLNGALLLNEEGSVRVIAAGEVFF